MKTLAVIGAGKWGSILIRYFIEMGVLHSVCDTREAAELGLADLPEVKIVKNFSEILNNDQIKQVYIITPPFTHYSLAKQSLLAGKDTFVEKPMCLAIEEAEELNKIAEEKKRILMVGHIMQYHPAISTMQELVKKGEIGEVHYIQSTRLNLGIFRTQENVLWSFAPHDISIVLSLHKNELPLEVYCLGKDIITPGIPDNCIMALKFKDGAQSHIHTSWLHPFFEQKVIVTGSNGILLFDDSQGWENKLKIFKQPITWMNNFPVANKSEGKPIPLSPEEPYKLEFDHFLTCCRDRQPPKTDGKEGARVVKVLVSAQKALQSTG